MRFTVRHLTEYSYESPVALAAHRLRLTPRPDAGRLLSRDLVILPEPATREVFEDEHGNPVVALTFEGVTDRLRIDSRFALETTTVGPVPDDLPLLPWAAIPRQGPVAEFARGLAAQADGAAARFLALLNTTLHTRTDRRIRQSGYAQTPEETLETATGACRDLAMLFIAACDAQGLRARFVSGYQARAESVDGQRHLHAWPEVFLPGHGWQGYDPTHGTMVSDGHVALAVAPAQDGTMPVEGGYFGPPTPGGLRYEIEIDAVEG